MKKFISQETIQRIKSTCSIRDIIAEYVQLSKRGTNWVGLCPFHGDKDPSFSVNEEKGFFYCFGCNKTGNVIRFLMEIDGITFQEAIKKLALRFGIPIDSYHYEQISGSHDEKTELININRLSMEFYRENFLLSNIAQEYVKKRGLTNPVINDFSIGFAPDGWNNLMNYLHSKGISNEKAEKAGLLIKNEKDHFYDRFRSRLIFPIFNHNGEVSGFGGRTFGDDKPKYLNSSETPVYKKGSMLYGFFQNKEAVRKRGQGFIVEGYMDLLALNQHGIKPVVATLGTAMTLNHVQHLRGLCKDWVLVFDGDEAGEKAAARSIPLFYSLDMRVKVFSLPEEHDPDTFIQRFGIKEWENQTKTIPTGIDYLIERGNRLNGLDPDGKTKTIADLMPVIDQISDSVRKSLVVSNISQKMGIKEKTLWKKVVDKDKDKKTYITAKNEIDFRKKFKDQSELMLIAFILKNGELIRDFQDSGIDMWLKDDDLKDLWHEMDMFFCQNGVCIPLDLLFQRFPREFIDSILEKTPIYTNDQEKSNILDELVKFSKYRKDKALRGLILDQLRCDADKNCDITGLLRNYKGLL